MKVIQSVHPEDFKSYDTNTIRERFLIDKLVTPDTVNCTYTHYDRMIIGTAHPVNTVLELPNYPNLKSKYFLERREIGVINIAGDGIVVVDNTPFKLNKLDCLYIGKGIEKITFQNANPESPAIFYLLSAPAHAVYPTTLLTHAKAIKVTLGSQATANHRVINKYIHSEGTKSCQLVMGLTILYEGSVWNTMPVHVHDRRMEAYFYFDLPAGQKIFHYMGDGQETRHITMNNYDAVVSPPWSIHSGCGTSNYSFIWGMAGENQNYTDMDAIDITDLL